MWKTYLSSSFKILSKHRVTAVINILGLSLSLSCIILILLFVQDEFQYDRFHQKGDRIYRVTRDFWSEGTQSLHLATVPAPVGAYLEEEFPELEASLRMMKTEAHFLVDNQGFKEESGYYAEASIFELFDFQLLQGNPAKSLDEPFTLLLSQDLAQKYYPQQQIVGKTLLFKIHDQKIPLRITGVFEALPSHSHFHPQFLISFPTLESNKVYRNGPHPRFWGREGLRNNWGANSFLTYVLLPESSNPAAFASRLDPFMDKYFSSYAISEGWWQEGEQKKASDFSHLYLQKLGDIHLYSHLDMEAEVNGEILNVYIFSLIALLILIIAVINYVNLSIAQSAQRAKEIGVRKVIGAQRENLIFQFLLESSALTLLAIFLALGLVELVLPFLNDFLGKTLSLGVLMQPFWIMGGSVLWLLLSFIAGIYPAWYLSSFDPVLVLKGGMLYGYKGGFLRKALVT
ncbi:MAG: ABC transporter permease, partial [Bacteroidota bacterium]